MILNSGARSSKAMPITVLVELYMGLIVTLQMQLFPSPTPRFQPATHIFLKDKITFWIYLEITQYV